MVLSTCVICLQSGRQFAFDRVLDQVIAAWKSIVPVFLSFQRCCCSETFSSCIAMFESPTLRKGYRLCKEKASRACWKDWQVSMLLGFGMIDLERCMCAPCTVPGLYPVNVELPQKVSDVVLTCDLEVRNDSRILVVWVSSVDVMLCCGFRLRWYF